MNNEERQGRTGKREQGRENEQKQVSDNVVSSVDANNNLVDHTDVVEYFHTKLLD